MIKPHQQSLMKKMKINPNDRKGSNRLMSEQGRKLFMLLLLSVSVSGISGCFGTDKKADANANKEASRSVDTDSANNSDNPDFANQAVEDAIIYRPVQTLKVSMEQTHHAYSFSGFVQADKVSNLSFRVAGTISQLPVKIGNYVSKGDLIAVLDDTDYHVNYSSTLANQKNIEASKQAIAAQIKQAEAESIRAKAAYQRAEKLFETNTIPVSEFEQARAAWQAANASVQGSQLQYAAAEAQVEAAKQQAKSAQNQLGYTALYAPFSGVISQVLVEENEQINAGSPIVVLSNTKAAEIEVGLPASIIAQVKKGTQVQASFFDFPKKSYSGVVSQVAYSTTNSSVYPVIVKLTDAGNEIRPGMTANVTFDFGKHTDTALFLPTTAIGEDQQGKFIYTLKKTDNKEKSSNKTVYLIQRQPITLGELKSNGFEVISGVTPDMLIARAGLNVLQENDEVTLYKPDELSQ